MPRSKNAAPVTPSPSQSSSSSPSKSITVSSNSEERSPSPKVTPSTKRKNPYQKLHPERGFVLEDIPEGMRKVLKKLSLEKFAADPSTKPITTITREFYTGIHTRDGELTDYSVVRKRLITFESTSINMHYGLRGRGVSLEEVVARADGKEMEALKKRLAKPGVKWFQNRGGEYKIRRTELLDEAKIWFNLVSYKLIPTTHVTYIEKERLVLLDLLMRGEKVNIGEIIEREIKACHKKTGGYLFFPCLITDLCLKADVPVEPSEERWPMMKAIDAQTLERCKSVLQPKKPPARKETTPKQPETCEAVPAASIAAPLLQQFMRKQQAFWKYVKEHNEWQHSVYFDNWILDKSPPAFPDWILPKATTQEEENSGQSGPSRKRKREEPSSSKGKATKSDSASDKEEEEENDDSLDNIARHYSSESPKEQRMEEQGEEVEKGAEEGEEKFEGGEESDKEEEENQEKGPEKEAEPIAPSPKKVKETPASSAAEAAAATAQAADFTPVPKYKYTRRKQVANRIRKPDWVKQQNKAARELAQKKQEMFGGSPSK